MLRAVDIGFDGADGALDNQANADGGGEMNNNVGIVDELRDKLPIFNGVEMIFHAIGNFQMPNVLHASCGEIVEEDDVVTAIEKPLGEM